MIDVLDGIAGNSKMVDEHDAMQGKAT